MYHLTCKFGLLPHPVLMNKLTVLYNDQCPVCTLEINHYRELCAKNKIELGFEKISDQGPVLTMSDLSVQEAKRRLHVKTESGELKDGIDAFLALWNLMPGYRILGKVLALPGIYRVSNWIYDGVLAPLLYWWDTKRN